MTYSTDEWGHLYYQFSRLSHFQQYVEFQDTSHLDPKYLEDFPQDTRVLNNYLEHRTGLKEVKATLQHTLRPLGSLHKFESSAEVLDRLLQITPGRN